MSNIDNDLFTLKKYMNNKYIYNSINNNTTISFESEDLIYPFTNEELNVLFNMDLTNKSALLVTSSGDHLLHAVLNGCFDITSFDINIFSKYYSNLKIAMIKKYDYKKFVKNITDFINACDKTSFNLDLIYNLLNEVSSTLSNEDNIFWNEFFKLYSKSIYRDNVFKLGNTMSFCSYYDENAFYQLENKLSNVKINYIDSDISTIDLKTDKLYDYIHLSNILDYIKDEDTFIEIFVKLYNMLKHNGVIDASIVGIFRNKDRIKKLSNYYDIASIISKQTDDVRFRIK